MVNFIEKFWMCFSRSNTLLAISQEWLVRLMRNEQEVHRLDTEYIICPSPSNSSMTSCETNTGATGEVPAPNQSWRGCNHSTSNWPYQGQQIPYLVPRNANWLSPLWSNTDHWPYAAGVCIVTGMSWWILHSRLDECFLRDNSWDLHSRIPARSGILLSDMM